MHVDIGEDGDDELVLGVVLKGNMTRSMRTVMPGVSVLRILQRVVHFDPIPVRIAQEDLPNAVAAGGALRAGLAGKIEPGNMPLAQSLQNRLQIATRQCEVHRAVIGY